MHQVPPQPQRTALSLSLCVCVHNETARCTGPSGDFSELVSSSKWGRTNACKTASDASLRTRRAQIFPALYTLSCCVCSSPCSGENRLGTSPPGEGCDIVPPVCIHTGAQVQPRPKTCWKVRAYRPCILSRVSMHTGAPVLKKKYIYIAFFLAVIAIYPHTVSTTRQITYPSVRPDDFQSRFVVSEEKAPASAEQRVCGQISTSIFPRSRRFGWRPPLTPLRTGLPFR